MEAEISSLRSGAARWSLASDQRLLETLQRMHQKIINKCSETTSQLQTMVTSLDDASVSLQNANNRFMALSNSQFIESRVSEDDNDVAAEIPTQSYGHREVPVSPSGCSAAPAAVSVSSSGLAALQRLHEQLTVLPDSDSSDSSDDDQGRIRVVLKPKDLYASRPLPYIIGSHAWKTKWHAGLVAEDSESDSSESKRSPERELYSDSEPEDTPLPALGPRDEVSSRSSSECPSPAAPPARPLARPPARTPAEVAGELARRLGGPLPAVPATHALQAPEPDDSCSPEDGPAVTVRKEYRVERPPAAIIFPSEPPPLSSSDQSEPEDIFAELHRQTKGSGPYDSGSKVHNAADDLFGFVEEPPPPTHGVKRNTVHSPEQSGPELLAPAQKSVVTDNKKPVGGISLFGTNRNNESIGAAILKRNQRKSDSDESDGSCQTSVRSVKPQVTDEATSYRKNKDHKNIEVVKEKDVIKGLFTKTEGINTVNDKEKHTNKNLKDKQNTDIFDDLFAKSHSIQNKENNKEQKPAKKKQDLFSENIFDDIDDIFTSNIPKVTLKEPRKEQVTKSLFDDDDSDLFSNVGISIKENVENKSTNNSKKENKSIFDSDDDELFSEKGVVHENKLNVEDNRTCKTENKLFIKREAKYEIKTSTIENKSMFDSDEELFTEKVSKNKIQSDIKSFDAPKIADNKVEIINTARHEIESKEKNILGDSKDDNSIFTNIITAQTTPSTPNAIKETNESTNSDTIINQSKQDVDMFGDEDENLFCKRIKDDEIKETAELFGDHVKDSEATTEKKSENSHINENVFSNEISNIENDWGTGIQETASVVNDVLVTVNKTKNTLRESKNYSKAQDNIVSKPDIVKESVRETKINAVVDEKSTNDNKTPEILLRRESDSTKTQRTTVTKKEVSHEQTSSEAVSFSDTMGTYDSIPSGLSNKDVEEHEQNIVTDIFNDLPPVFEKPKEPKKSKNINALFDDDSDDEALFFKKNDTMVDDSEKLDDFSPGAEVRLSGLFHDEPPAIDIDFMPKPSKTANDDKNKELVQKTADAYSTKDEQSNADTILISTSKAVDTSKSSVEMHKQLIKSKDDLDSADKKTDDVNSKKVGKLKSNINLNINVNTLLPGASPKKILKLVEQLDQPDDLSIIENIKDQVSTENSDNIESKLSKSVSFDGKPDSSTLDSKLSKERAKIQVKRRPSTRRARREAVKKSGIDFGDDTTDNLNSMGDYQTSAIDDIRTSVDKEVNKDWKEPEPKTNDCDKKKEIDTDFKTDTASDLTQNAQLTEDLSDIVKHEVINKPEESQTNCMKSKLVYILNDEDIFTDTKTDFKDNLSSQNKAELLNPKENASFNIKNTRILNIVDDGDDIFESMIKTIKTEEPETKIKGGINTLGKVYSDQEKNIETTKEVTDRFINIVTASESQPMLLEQSNKRKDHINEEIHNKGVFKAIPKTSLFDDLSDSENELFGNTKTKTNKAKENKHPENKLRTKTLFESDSDDDLFGIRSKKNEKDVGRSTNKEIKKIEVKSSVYGDDDDEITFGGAKKDSGSTLFPSKPSSSTRDVTPEPVFDDPLSLLRDDAS